MPGQLESTLHHYTPLTRHWMGTTSPRRILSLAAAAGALSGGKDASGFQREWRPSRGGSPATSCNPSWDPGSAGNSGTWGSCAQSRGWYKAKSGIGDWQRQASELATAGNPDSPCQLRLVARAVVANFQAWRAVGPAAVTLHVAFMTGESAAPLAGALLFRFREAASQSAEAVDGHGSGNVMLG
ncbi:hypothetical protein V494_00379 [Pseudogymnoascus sp. VKM F-4513 (FW-928)]|nr:hypothetical protein V490_05763 [Pseudogymnoascus sp. VKM F-3557]KFY46688.1 hypothetical protein V494_00379 [Pseudogymnoascus sp. VKM F-4513 (FW-928)]